MARRKRDVPEQKRRVVGLYPEGCASKPETAQMFLDTALANSAVKSVIITVVDPHGIADTRVFGTLCKQEMIWVGAQLTRWGGMATE